MTIAVITAELKMVSQDIVIVRNVMAESDDQRCWKCNFPIPKLVHLNSALMLLHRAPMPGDVSICAACGAFGVFDTLLQVLKPTLQEMQAIMNTPELVQMQANLLSREGM